MHARSLSARVLLIGLLAGSCAATVAIAQPSAQPGTGAGERGGRGGGSGAAATQQPMDAKALRQFIEQRLDTHRQSLKRLEDALKKLDAGGDAAAISKELLDAAREDRRGGAGNRAAGGEEGGQRPAGGIGEGGGSGGWRANEFNVISGPRLNPEERVAAYKLLEEKHPELLRKVVALAGDNPETVTRFKDGVGGRLRWLETVREKDPEEARLRLVELTNGLDLMKLGRDLTEAKKQGTFESDSALRGRLQVAMTTQFDTRQQLSKLLLKKLRERADKQEADIAAKDKDREAQIKQRADEFLKMIDGKSKKTEKGEAEATPSKPASPAKR